VSIFSIVDIEWAANWASSVEYHGTMGLRLSSLDFSALVFLWDASIATRGPQRSCGLGPQLSWGLPQRQKLGTALWQSHGLFPQNFEINAPVCNRAEDQAHNRAGDLASSRAGHRGRFMVCFSTELGLFLFGPWHHVTESPNVRLED
jgi:hypothetical protein